MRKFLSTAVVLMLALIGAGSRVEAQFGLEKVAFTIIVAAPDTKQQHKAIQAAVDALVSGQQCTGVGTERTCEYYTLNADPTKQALGVFIVNGDVALNLGNQLEKADSMYLPYTLGAAMTREQLRVRAARVAYHIYGAKQWVLIEAGQDLTDLQSRIEPLFVPL